MRTLQQVFNPLYFHLLSEDFSKDTHLFFAKTGATGSRYTNRAMLFDEQIGLAGGFYLRHIPFPAAYSRKDLELLF